MTAVAVFRTVALDCPDPAALARFYSAVTGAEIVGEDADWVQLAAPEGGAALAFQLAPDHQPPDWPGAERGQQLHLDLYVDDLDTAEAQVLELGAHKHEHQPGKSFRVYLDPAGHPFCLCLNGG